MSATDSRAELRADCSRCVGLCCIVPAFERSADFAIRKPARTACTHLRPDFRCGIHSSLRAEGMPGCEVFDCLGAGQQTVQVTFRGSRADPAMFDVFEVLRQVQEARWYLVEAVRLAGPLAEEVATQQRRAAELAAAEPTVLLGLDVAAYRREVGDLLGRVSDAARAGMSGRDLRHADLVGARLRGRDLRGASLRGAYVIGADLRGADLRRADLLGADLRAADLRGADLSAALFLTQPQLTAAIGDAATRLPDFLSRPAHWA